MTNRRHGETGHVGDFQRFAERPNTTVAFEDLDSLALIRVCRDSIRSRHHIQTGNFGIDLGGYSFPGQPFGRSDPEVS